MCYVIIEFVIFIFFTDIHGSMVPILLNCGHDMCKKCLKYVYKTNKQIICPVCRACTKYKSFFLYYVNLFLIINFIILIII